MSSSSPPAGGGVGSCWAFFGVSAQLVLGHLRFFRSVSCSWLPFWGSTPGWLRLADLLLRWRVLFGVVLVQMSCYPLCFFLVPAQLPLPLLPLWGSTPLTGELACLTPVCWTSSSSGTAACAAFPAAGYLRVFRSPGVCTSASLVTWVGLQPFPSFMGFSCSACLLG